MISPSDDDASFACGQLAAGCDSLERLLLGLLESGDHVAGDVHAIRKLGKSLRGGFSLFGLGKSSAKEIQAVGRLLSGPRDAVSRFGTWRKLQWEGDALTEAAISRLLEQQTHSTATQPPPEAITWCIERTMAARANLLALPPADLAGRITRGIHKLGKQVAKRCRKMDEDGVEDFHDARKALKAYLGALAFLPKGAVEPSSCMVELADILGDENDLATLSAWLEEHGFTPDFAPFPWEQIRARRKKLRKRAIKDANLLSGQLDRGMPPSLP